MFQHPDGTLSTTVYRKKTHTDKYLHFQSHHPLAHKVAVTRTLFSRAQTLCSTVSAQADEEKHVSKALRMNGYPARIVNQRHPSRQMTPPDTKPPRATVVIPYVRNLSESIRRVLTPLRIRTCFKPHQTLSQILVHPKDPVPPPPPPPPPPPTNERVLYTGSPAQIVG